MDERTEKIKEIENQIEDALWSFELHDEMDTALEVYRETEIRLGAFEITTEEPAFAELQRVLAYCLMRQGNLLRQMDKSDEALAIGEREIAAAQASNDAVTLARSLMSNGTNHIITGEAGKGTRLIDEAREIFEGGESYDHQQGLGWYWILQADLANAGIIKRNPAEVLEIAGQALTILKPIENWSGVARAYAARVAAYERMGNEDDAAGDHKEQAYYESKVESKKTQANYTRQISNLSNRR